MTIRYTKLPSLTSLYLKAALARKPGLKRDATLPKLSAAIDGITFDEKALDAYRTSCAFAPGDTLPLPAPHILAAPIHTALLAHKDFPLKAMGLIHARNTIIQHRPISANTPLDLYVGVGETRWVKKGCEFDILTTVKAEGEKVWEEITVVFARGPKDPNATTENPIASETVQGVPDPPIPDLDETWSLAGDLGRKYASVSGDKNPIHLWPLTAKLFGFKRPIIHGMWTLARSMAAMADEVGDEKARMEIRFKRPVFLPSEVRYLSTKRINGQAFSLETPDREKTYLSGSLIIGAGA
jgi:acyl dehydratase